jgi:hypothetical protein
MGPAQMEKAECIAVSDVLCAEPCEHTDGFQWSACVRGEEKNGMVG